MKKTATNDNNALKHIKNAEKKLKPSIPSKLFYDSNYRFEEAAKSFYFAANLYKKNKEWRNAAKTYERSAEAYKQGHSLYDASTQYINASGCYRRVSSIDTIRCLENAVDLLASDGKFVQAAKYHKTIAELYENSRDIKNSTKNYEIAAEYFSSEGSKTSARNCKLKVALFAAENEDYSRAIEILEDISCDAQDTIAGPYICKEYFLQCGLCYLAHDDIIGLRQALIRYKETLATFENTREYKLLIEIADACDNYDIETFTNIVTIYNKLTPFDTWKMNILCKIKHLLISDDNDYDNNY